ncbi:MAG: tRNA guanosine(34) transglycosylase Tgt [Pseudomonadota bacterium]
MGKAFSFSISHTDGKARRGQIMTPHGLVETPAFMPVGTAGTVKALYADQVRDTGADVVLGNVYHLMLRPTAERVAKLGGLHTFMRWPHTILTDSGGFQIMSLGDLRTLDESGVVFKSHIDGTRHELSPERSIEIQGLLGSDIQMQLDECIALPAERSEVIRAMELSARWAERSKQKFQAVGGPQKGQGLYGIVQGGTDIELRLKSVELLTDIGFWGYSVGGLAVGEPQDEMLAVLDETCPALPTDRPRYLMGLGTPDDLIKSVARGIDMFDCVMPTRAGRHATAYTRFGRINLKNARHAEDHRPLDEESKCPAARDYSRAYLHHLVRTNEPLAGMLLSWNNIAYYQALMRSTRIAIEDGVYDDFVDHCQTGWKRGDIAPLNT